MSLPLVSWHEAGQLHHAAWLAENHTSLPKRIQVVGDNLSAGEAFKLINQGTHLLWRGDFHNARQLQQALVRRLDRKPSRSADPAPELAFLQHRQIQARRARLLNMLLLPLEPSLNVPLRRAPDVADACRAALSVLPDQPALLSLRNLQGIIGAYEWYKKGVEVPAAGGRIHVRYGVYSPIRGEYLDLVARTPLPPGVQTAFDIGTGSGVLAAILAQRGVPHIIATDTDPHALQCAHDNLERLGHLPRVQVLAADLFPPGQAQLIVCNPPWLPARPTSRIEHAIYDPDHRMLKGFLAGLHTALAPHGQAWLILSDLAEHLHLRSRQWLLDAFTHAGLSVIARHDTRPRHPKTLDTSDPLHDARAREITSLWCLQKSDADTPVAVENR